MSLGSDNDVHRLGALSIRVTAWERSPQHQSPKACCVRVVLSSSGEHLLFCCSKYSSAEVPTVFQVPLANVTAEQQLWGGFSSGFLWHHIQSTYKNPVTGERWSLLKKSSCLEGLKTILCFSAEQLSVITTRVSELKLCLWQKQRKYRQLMESWQLDKMYTGLDLSVP